jgi:hypothetical protein
VTPTDSVRTADGDLALSHCVKCGTSITKTPWIYPYTAFDQTKVFLREDIRAGDRIRTYSTTEHNHLLVRIAICRNCGGLALGRHRKQDLRHLWYSAAFTIAFLFLGLLAIKQSLAKRSDIAATMVVVSVGELGCLGILAFLAYEFQRGKRSLGSQYYSIIKDLEPQVITERVLSGRSNYRRDYMTTTNRDLPSS